MLGAALTAWERIDAAAPMLSLTVGPLARRPARSHLHITACRSQLHHSNADRRSFISPCALGRRREKACVSGTRQPCMSGARPHWPASAFPTIPAWLMMQPDLAPQVHLAQLLCPG